jgi:hypothetical protein
MATKAERDEIDSLLALVQQQLRCDFSRQHCQPYLEAAGREAHACLLQIGPCSPLVGGNDSIVYRLRDVSTRRYQTQRRRYDTNEVDRGMAGQSQPAR